MRERALTNRLCYLCRGKMEGTLRTIPWMRRSLHGELSVALMHVALPFIHWGYVWRYLNIDSMWVSLTSVVVNPYIMAYRTTTGRHRAWSRKILLQTNLQIEIMQDTSNDVDQVEQMLKKTGCIELHYKVQVNRRNIPCCISPSNNSYLLFFEYIVVAGVHCRNTRLAQVSEHSEGFQEVHDRV